MNETFVFGPFRLFPNTRVLQKDDVDVAMGSRAFDILTALLKGNGCVLTHRELMAIAWPHMVVDVANVRVQVANIRRTLNCGQGGTRYIASVTGRGYCFVAIAERFEALEPPTVATRSSPVALAAGDVPNLPTALASALGRDDSVSELTERAQAGRLVTVVGAAGVGKTTLAVLVAHQLLHAFESAVFFVDLSSVECADLLTEAVAAAFGYHASGGDLLPGLLEVLAARRALIVLDNCEHLVDRVALFCRQVIDETASVVFLNTSREALRVGGEFVYLLQPLAYPSHRERMTARQAMAWPAVQLFMARAREGGARETLSDDDTSTVAALCRRLDGNPHAIGLVASQVATYGVQGIADLLASQSTLHWKGHRDACPRQRTVEAMIDWSHDLLVERDRRVLARLSVFSGGFALDAAVAVAADQQIDAEQVAEAVSDLVYKSLVAIVPASGGTQLRLLETTRAYAAARLARLDDSQVYARRHALYYAEELRKLKEARSVSTVASLQALPLDMGNVRAAIDWAHVGDVSLAVEISCMAAPLLLALGMLRECKRCCERALLVLPEHLQSTQTELELLESTAITYYAGGDYDGQMTPVVERGLELSIQRGDLRSRFHFLAGLHLAMMANGRFEASRAVSKRYASLAASHGGPCEAIIARWMDGSSQHFLGGQREAEERYAQAADLVSRYEVRPLQYFETKQKVVASLGEARMKWIRGMPVTALHLASKAISDSRQNPDSFYLCVTLCFPILLANDLLDWAQELVQELERAALDYKVAVRRPVIFFLSGLLLLQKGQFQVAVEHLQQCLACLPAPTMSVVRTDALQALAEAQQALGRDVHALASIEEAIALVGTTQGAFNLADLLRTKADVMLSLPSNTALCPEALLAQAMACARQQSALAWELRVAMALTQADAVGTRNPQAWETLRAVYSRFTEGFDTRELKALAEALRVVP